MSKLSNKVAVVTGGSTGIGLATARRFIADGAQVVITGRNQGALDAAVGELGDRATGIHGDVANLEDLDRLFAQVRSPPYGLNSTTGPVTGSPTCSRCSKSTGSGRS